MFSVYKTVHPPTGIDNSVFCYFINSKEQNLIISNANRLQIFRLNPDLNKQKKQKLECIETFNFYGNIVAMKSCRYGSMTKDALVLAFDDAKVQLFFSNLPFFSIYFHFYVYFIAINCSIRQHHRRFGHAFNPLFRK